MTRYQTYQMPYGFATSSAVWQIQKIDETTGMVITWAGTYTLPTLTVTYDQTSTATSAPSGSLTFATYGATF